MIDKKIKNMWEAVFVLHSPEIIELNVNRNKLLYIRNSITCNSTVFPACSYCSSRMYYKEAFYVTF